MRTNLAVYKSELIMCFASNFPFHLNAPFPLGGSEIPEVNFSNRLIVADVSETVCC